MKQTKLLLITLAIILLAGMAPLHAQDLGHIKPNLEFSPISNTQLSPIFKQKADAPFPAVGDDPCGCYDGLAYLACVITGQMHCPGTEVISGGAISAVGGNSGKQNIGLGNAGKQKADTPLPDMPGDPCACYGGWDAFMCSIGLKDACTFGGGTSNGAGSSSGYLNKLPSYTPISTTK